MRSLPRKKKRTRKPKPPVPIARFRVYGWRSSLYFIVNIWATKKDLHANRRANGLRRDPGVAAHVFSYDVVHFYGDGRPPRKRPIVGEINFYKGRLGAGVISHESFHATASLLRRLKFDFESLGREDYDNRKMEQEELAAMVCGEFVRRITVQLYDRKIIDG